MRPALEMFITPAIGIVCFAIILLRRFDAEKDFPRMKAKLLYVLCTTDKRFPPSIAPVVMAKLKAAGVEAEFFELTSELGHVASGLDAAKWAPTLQAFLERVAHQSQQHLKHRRVSG